MQDPSVLRPSAWAVRTPRRAVAVGKEEWIRLGLEDKDLQRQYNSKDVLEEVAFMYQTALSVYDREVYATPVMPQLAKNVTTLKDFAMVRGWFAITLGPKKGKAVEATREPGATGADDKESKAQAQNEQNRDDDDDDDDEDDETENVSDFAERMIREVETAKLEFEQLQQQEQEKFDMEREALMQQKEAELQSARAQWEQEQREREDALRKEWETKLEAERKRVRELLESGLAQITDDAAKQVLAGLTSQV